MAARKQRITKSLVELYSSKKINAKDIEESIENNDEQYSDYEEEESLVEETNDINAEKYHFKEKVADFNKEGWDNLDEEARVILNEHRFAILNAKNYQEQVQIVFTLIYSPRKKDKRGYEAIGSLFGVSKGSVFNILKRMKTNKKNRKTSITGQSRNDIFNKEGEI